MGWIGWGANKWDGWDGIKISEHSTCANTGTKAEEISRWKGRRTQCNQPEKVDDAPAKVPFQNRLLKQADTFRDSTKRSWNNNDAPAHIKLLSTPPQSMGCQDDETLHH